MSSMYTITTLGSWAAKDDFGQSDTEKAAKMSPDQIQRGVMVISSHRGS
jgi:hypothetical protein